MQPANPKAKTPLTPLHMEPIAEVIFDPKAIFNSDGMNGTWLMWGNALKIISLAIENGCAITK